MGVTTCAVATNAWKKWHEGEENPSLKDRVGALEKLNSEIGHADDRRDAAPRSRLTRGNTPAYAGTCTRRYDGKRRLFAPQSPTIELRMGVQATAIQAPENQLLGSKESLIFGAVLLVPFLALAFFGRRSGSRQDKTRLSYIL